MDCVAKILISKEDGRRVGYVLDRALDCENLISTGYYVVDEETEGEFFVKTEDVLSESREFVLIDNASVLQFVSTRKENLFGKIVIDDQGNNYGYVENLILKKNKIEKIITNKCEIIKKNIKKIGFDAIFVGFSKNKNKKNNFIFSEKHKFSNIVVTVQQPIQSYVQEKVNLSTEYYIGKVSLRDVFGYNNERIVAKGAVVSKNIVAKAKKHNKLNELFFALKR